MKKLGAAALIFAAALSASFTASAQLPSVQLKTVDGRTVDTAKLSNDGKPFVVTFWATWCKPCLRELKAIHEVYPDWVEETGVKVYAVSVDQAQSQSRVKPLADAEGWEYEVLLDPNSEFARLNGVQNVPHLLIVDGEGNVVETHSGYTDGSEEHIIDVVRGLVK